MHQTIVSIKGPKTFHLFIDYCELFHFLFDKVISKVKKQVRNSPDLLKSVTIANVKWIEMVKLLKVQRTAVPVYDNIVPVEQGSRGYSTMFSG